MIFNLCLWAKVFVYKCIKMLERGNMNQNVLSAKQDVVSEISSKFKDSEAVVIAEYRGLSVAEMTELRRNLRAEDVEFKVYKNTMAQRAVDEIGFSDLKEFLTGPNAIAFSKDVTAPARVLANFAKKHEALVLKSGIVEGKIVGLDTLNELSTLPNRDGMLSMLLSCLTQPVASFARVVKAVADARDNGEVKPAEETKPTEEAKPAEEAKPVEEKKEEPAPASAEPEKKEGE